MIQSSRRSKRPSPHRVNSLLASWACLVLLAGCGGGGPTAPPLEVQASIGGQVVDSANGLLGPVTGVTVRVLSTGVSTTTDGQGRFSLAPVPMGDQTLAFEHSGQTASLAIDNIRSAENIQMVVALTGSTVEVRSMDRGSGATNTPGEARVTLEKATNGEDADRPPGPSIPVGDPVAWTYVVANVGDVVLSGIGVTDDQGVVVGCPSTTLAPGESMTCTASDLAVAGQYANVGSVAAVDPDGQPVGADDASHYFGVDGAASIDIEKSTNGQDADKAPGPSILVGEPVFWEYFVVNDGGVDLFDIVVSDDQGVVVECPLISLPAGEAMSCTAAGIAVEGQYENLGFVTAGDGKGNVVDDEDLSHYFGEVNGEESFTVDIQPDHWNTNWPGSSGTVSAKIQGGDLTTVETGTIVLFEADPLDVALPTSTPSITGNHIRADFAKADAFAILVSPQTGDTRTVTVRFVAAGVTVELQAEVEIVGPAI